MANWSFDPSHSSVGFSVRRLMISKVRGQFGKWSGTFEYDAANPSAARLEVHIDAASIDTRDEKRDAHLRSPDFFDVEKFPELTFKSTGVTADGDDLVLAGDLTIHGITRPVQLKVESLGSYQGSVGRHARRFQRAHLGEPQGLRPALEPGARDRRRRRR